MTVASRTSSLRNDAVWRVARKRLDISKTAQQPKQKKPTTEARKDVLEARTTCQGKSRSWQRAGPSSVCSGSHTAEQSPWQVRRPGVSRPTRTLPSHLKEDRSKEERQTSTTLPASKLSNTSNNLKYTVPSGMRSPVGWSIGGVYFFAAGGAGNPSLVLFSVGLSTSIPPSSAVDPDGPDDPSVPEGAEGSEAGEGASGKASK